jgi:hypothetical protein
MKKMKDSNITHSRWPCCLSLPSTLKHSTFKSLVAMQDATGAYRSSPFLSSAVDKIEATPETEF